jgi:DNA-binding MarR family transcriptional regulator
MHTAREGENAASAVGIGLSRLVRRWGRQANAELVPVGLTLVQWSILEETHGLILGSGDAVSQTAVAVRMEMDKMTLSHAMRTLQERGLLDRGPDLTGPAYRIRLTSWGQRARQQAGARVEAVSLATFGPDHDRLREAIRAAGVY